MVKGMVGRLNECGDWRVSLKDESFEAKLALFEDAVMFLEALLDLAATIPLLTGALTPFDAVGMLGLSRLVATVTATFKLLSTFAGMGVKIARPRFPF